MSSLRKPALYVLAGAALWAVAAGPAFAEVFALLNPDGSYGGVRTVRPADARSSPWAQMGIAESRRLVLNPDGELRGDGTPAIVHDPATGLPFAAWGSGPGGGERRV